MPRRRYSVAEKDAAVAEAARTSILAASQKLGIPERTVGYWYDSPEFADVRDKTKDQLAAGSVAMAILAQGELVRRIRSGKLSDQALVAAYGVGIDKAQLLSGAATTRTESRSLVDGMDDHEREALRKVLDEAINDAG